MDGIPDARGASSGLTTAALIPVGDRREHKKEVIRQRIYDAALALFRRQGIAATTIRQIAQEADIGVGTFFNYFAGKEAVLAEFGGRQIERVEALVTTPEFAALTTRSRIEAILRLLVEGVESEPELMRGAVEAVLHSPALFSGERRRFVVLGALLLALLREGQERGEIRPDADIASATQMLIGSYAMMTLDWASGISEPLAPDADGDDADDCPRAFLPQLLAHVELLWHGLVENTAPTGESGA